MNAVVLWQKWFPHFLNRLTAIESSSSKCSTQFVPFFRHFVCEFISVLCYTLNPSSDALLLLQHEAIFLLQCLIPGDCFLLPPPSPRTDPAFTPPYIIVSPKPIPSHNVLRPLLLVLLTGPIRCQAEQKQQQGHQGRLHRTKLGINFLWSNRARI